MNGKNRVAVESDVYNFECVLAFVTIHPWANGKWVIDQSEHALYLSYVIMVMGIHCMVCD